MAAEAASALEFESKTRRTDDVNNCRCGVRVPIASIQLTGEVIIQQLVTIYLDSSHLPAKGLLGNATSENHGMVERHLERELAAGWRVKMLHGFGGHGDHLYARGWLTVVLEKDDA